MLKLRFESVPPYMLRNRYGGSIPPPLCPTSCCSSAIASVTMEGTTGLHTAEAGDTPWASPYRAWGCHNQKEPLGLHSCDLEMILSFLILIFQSCHSLNEKSFMMLFWCFPSLWSSKKVFKKKKRKRNEMIKTGNNYNTIWKKFSLGAV